ncbi:DUF4178 domain-containing protein [Conchiformibius kuhniae]|uniref:DUF4178 domain-containing protein n=1 Tax=Conchiformibius kuhniae TaxID=211502 RepID=A0A8T9MWN4_9NEIS|nr:DUF4178 domain-containing protein [Conchiformibius kuhniae]UOP05564.1 DUF4178 domain-containing protein [Conchiformibius kuhniae]
MSTPFFHTDCPSCGAPVDVASPTAVTVVCGYCNSMLVLQDGSLNDTGRDSALLEDASPLQIGTTGRFAALGFALIGRIQARYDAGVWNEWYLRFEDGSNGWLAEAGDLYALTRRVSPPESCPEFSRIRAGETTLHYSKNFVASDVRDITLSHAAAQGELPFVLPEQWHNRVADWRCEQHFLTLDYGETPPAAYLGSVVSFESLSLGNLRDRFQIRQAAGRLRGERCANPCPHCGAPVHWAYGLTRKLICPACNSELDTSGKDTVLIAANNMRQAQQKALTLPIGTQGVWRGKAVTVMGAVRYEELDGDDARAALEGYPPEGIVPRGWWFAYLLYEPDGTRFHWLVETPEDGWFESETLAAFPRTDPHGNPQGKPLLYRYGGRVSYAAGAFYWQIRTGDVSLYTDYADGRAKLCAEQSRHELAWSRSTPIRFNREILTAFPSLGKRADQPRDRQNAPSDRLRRGLLGFYALINLPAWLTLLGRGDFGGLFMSAVVSVFVYQALMFGRDDA